MKSKLSVLLILFCSIQSLSAKDLGVFGKTYNIKEQNLLEAIHDELKEMQQDGRMDAINKKRYDTASNYAKQPPSVKGITTARTNKTYYYDPSITLKNAIYSTSGELIQPEGATANPLDYMTLSKPMVFFNSDDNKQLEWVENYTKELRRKPYYILTGGKVKKASDRLHSTVFFDQRGYITNKMSIKHVPAIAYQEDKFVRIDEIGMK